ncbi:restriction endonuclease subunit S [Methanoculleus bourgensis]|uniref:restriction endonuclease subunit S n=1 Tax=Methanoculleus bourgensis TaxID=83986 RepID=UPI0022EE1C89|nr:restriction endonuclease subunit S [Methanoculleus bourgensis]GLI46885.1 specificity protein S [Methanoculleus bourgensis]
MKWRRQKLESLASDEPYSFVGGPFGSKLTTRDYLEEGVPVIRGSNLNNGRFLGMSDFVFVSNSKVKKDLSSNLAKPGDLVFTQRGTLGQVALIPENGISDRYVVSQSQMKLTVDEHKADRLFLYYYFTSREAVERILNYTSSSGVPHINLTVLRNFEVPVPPLQTQQAIAGVLSTYDDLIENNRRRIALLEEAARLLYREWFVHLRFPGHEHVRIVDGVPEGWEKKPLGDVAPLNYGKALKKDDRVSGPFPVYGSSGVVGTHVKALVPGPTIIVGRKGNVGSVYWSPEDCHPIDTVYYIDSSRCSFHLYYALQHMSFINTDVAVPGLNRNFAHSRSVIIPEQKIYRSFEDTVTPMHSQIDILHKENVALAQARDLLLPRLMNGEIAV